MQSTSQIIRTGGICLILLALAIATVDIIDMVWFTYPYHAAGALNDLIPASLHSQGLRNLLTLSSLLPLLLIPGSVGVQHFLSDHAKGTMCIANGFAIVGVVAWVLSSMLWPSFNWYVGQSQLFTLGSPIDVWLVAGINSLIYVYIGQYLKFFCLAMWMFLVSKVAYQSKRLPSSLCLLGVIFAIMFWAVLIVRFLSGDLTILQTGFRYLPLVNFWVFLTGAFLVLRSKSADKGFLS